MDKLTTLVIAVLLISSGTTGTRVEAKPQHSSKAGSTSKLQHGNAVSASKTQNGAASGQAQQTPDNLRAEIKRAETQRQNHAYFEASAMVTNLLRRYPDDSEVNLTAGRLHRDMGLLARAEAEFQKVYAANPKSAEACSELSSIYLLNLDMPKALSFAERAKSLDPHGTNTRLNLASAYLASGKLKQADLELQSLLKTDPNNAQVQYAAYEACVSLNQNAEAQRHLEKAVSLASARPDWLVELSELYKNAGDYGDARRTLERALRAEPNSVDATNKLAVVFEFYLHDYEQAIEQYRNILAIDPESVVALAGIDRCKIKKNDIAGALKYEMQAAWVNFTNMLGKTQSE